MKPLQNALKDARIVKSIANCLMYSVRNAVPHAMHTILRTLYATKYAINSKYCIKFPCVCYAHAIAYGIRTVLHTICVFYTQLPYVWLVHTVAHTIRNAIRNCLHTVLHISCTRHLSRVTYSAIFDMLCTRYTQSIAHDIRIGCSINRISGTEVLKLIMYSYLIYCIFINKEADGERRPDRAVRALAAT